MSKECLGNKMSIFKRYTRFDVEHVPNFDEIWKSKSDSLICEAPQLITANIFGDTLIARASKDLSNLVTFHEFVNKLELSAADN